ncbi:MAG: MFS transporter [Phycisphaerae bacterium]|nr:MFS transporter [Phycisphaerae bacterium]
MYPALTDAQKQRRLPWLLGFQVLAACASNLSIFGSVIALFFNALGMDKTQIGFLFALLPFLGVLAPFISSYTARFGYKRATVLFLLIRIFPVILFLFLPIVQERFGKIGAFVLIACVMSSFGFFRVIAENGFIGWMQEIVPARIRGKYTSMEFLAMVLGVFLAFLLAGLFLENARIERYLWLIGVSLVIGFLSVATLLPVPGGKPLDRDRKRRASLRSVFSTYRDANFRRLVGGIGLAVFGITATMTFLPLFLIERAGFTPSGALLTQNAMLIGMVVFSYFWGWSSDRYGSRPVSVIGMVLMTAVIPAWLLLPEHHFLSGTVAAGLFFLMGMASVAYNVSANRQLYLIMPADKKEHYIPAYYMVFNVCLGLATLLGGLALDGFKSLAHRFDHLGLDPYVPLFVMSSLCCAASAWVFQRMHRRGDMETRKFAGMFVQGNPFSAMGLLVRHRWTGQEHQRISFVERLGDLKSPLTAGELIEALHDPSFHVRYEAVNSIARTPARTELVEALIDLLRDGETELRAAAAWALSRMRDPSALPALRGTLESKYPLLRSRAARALGILGDVESIDALRAGLRRETSPDLKVAYAAALGALHDRDAVEDILTLLAEAPRDVFRAECALALARILGGGHRFSLFWRRVRNDLAAGVSAAVLDLAKPIAKWVDKDPAVAEALEHASRALAHDDLDTGGRILAELVEKLPLFQLSQVAETILTRCARQLRNPHPARPEYILLILHALQEKTRT